MVGNNNRDKRIAGCQLTFGAGLVALIFATNFVPSRYDLVTAICLAVAGITAIAFSAAQWAKL